MIRRKWLIVTFAGVLLGPSTLNAQQYGADASVGFTEKAGRAAVSADWRVRVGPIVVGAGPRASFYFGEPALFRNQDEVSAGLPTRLSIDPSILGLNLMVLGEVRLAGPVVAGANLDLAGVALGPSQSAGGARVRPARGSLFRYGNADRGSLNSELFLAVRASRAWRFRAGVSHYVVGYRAESGGADRRYLRFDTVPFVAVGVLLRAN